MIGKARFEKLLEPGKIGLSRLEHSRSLASQIALNDGHSQTVLTLPTTPFTHDRLTLTVQQPDGCLAVQTCDLGKLIQH